MEGKGDGFRGVLLTVKDLISQTMGRALHFQQAQTFKFWQARPHQLQEKDYREDNRARGLADVERQS